MTRPRFCTRVIAATCLPTVVANVQILPEQMWPPKKLSNPSAAERKGAVFVPLLDLDGPQCRFVKPDGPSRLHVLSNAGWLRNFQTVCPEPVDMKTDSVPDFGFYSRDRIAGSDASGKVRHVS